ncbi:unnamed protein product [Rangifer tarandus platyrhynchus]|uniref:Uncharacterized protein n=1 Tax=Rangifer tarandus platyrhynchus TaxID=3082113 RepID=A0AC60A7D7_RANTA
MHKSVFFLKRAKEDHLEIISKSHSSGVCIAREDSPRVSEEPSVARQALNWVRNGSNKAGGTRLFLKDLCVLFKTQSESSGCLAPVFVYGTLKTGQPNHRVLLDGAHGRAAFRGRARTLEPYPLVIAGEHNIPWLLNLPGRGHRVAGEVYEVDGRMLRFLDEFEDCPDMYQRTRLRVALEGARAPLECFVYTTATYPPEWVHLPYLDDYDSQGKHGLRYNPRENR